MKMSNYSTFKEELPAHLLHKLCCRITGKGKEDVRNQLKFALEHLGSVPVTSPEQTEFFLSEKIKKHLAHEKGDREASRFSELYRKLLGTNVLKSCHSVLALLYALKHSQLNSTQMAFEHGLGADKASTPQSILREQATSGNTNHHRYRSGATLSTIKSIEATPMQPLYWTSEQRSRTHHTLKPRKDVEKSPQQMSLKRHGEPQITVGIPEAVLLQEIIYALQGVEGKVIQLDLVKDGFKIDPKVNIPSTLRRSVLRLTELGWLHGRVKKFCDDCSQSRMLGLVGQSLLAALREELSEYYRLIAVLEAQLHQEVDSPLGEEGGNLTTRRLTVWTLDPLNRMRTLAALVDACREKKGCALASTVHSFLQHGDPATRDMIKSIMATVCKPVYVMLSLWILDGELNDTYNEFFIASDPHCSTDRLWHDKYSLRGAMVPAFIPVSQAKKILSTGKSINFLKEVCKDTTQIRGREAMKHAVENTSVEALFLEDDEGDLKAMMDTAYRETSRRVLEVMTGQYKFLDHLQALRRYLLLGQGDFIRHFMELLEPELNRPASELFSHNLSCIMETAVRATNAQFEDADILGRLDVRLLEVSEGDLGWDVFSLDYHVNGPISTIFTAQSMSKYLQLFNCLWRFKRMEYVLSTMWKQQTTSKVHIRVIPELAPVLHKAHLLTSEMVHFVHQMQYYIMFEVLECSWDVLTNQVHQAGSLDDVIAAHKFFLDTIVSRALLDDASQELLAQLRTVLDRILEMQGLFLKVEKRIQAELKCRLAYREQMSKREAAGEFGTCEAEEVKEASRQREFTCGFLNGVVRTLCIYVKNYQKAVQKFLVKLASHSDVSLQGLSFRLDFNEHYKRKDSRLTSTGTLKLEHRRLSQTPGAGSRVGVSVRRVRSQEEEN